MRDISGAATDFSKFIAGKNCVLFTYPKMGESGKFLPENLLNLKGLTGCTNQCKAYQNEFENFKNLGFEVVAVGSQSIEDMRKFTASTMANFMFFSDEDFELEKLLNLQTFTTKDGKKFYHRQTLMFKNGEVIKRFDNVAEPENDAKNVMEFLKRI